MGKFIAGIIIGVLLVAGGAYVYLHYGYLDMRADQPLMRVERIYMEGAMERYAERSAPAAQNPIQSTDANLVEGIRLYKAHCALCHGGPNAAVSAVGEGLYPPAPQFLKHLPHMPENQNFWIIKHGISRTGMPAWGKIMSENEIWQVTAFLSRMEQLEKQSYAVQEAWRNGGQAPQNATTPSAQPAMPHPSEHTHSH